MRCDALSIDECRTTNCCCASEDDHSDPWMSARPLTLDLVNISPVVLDFWTAPLPLSMLGKAFEVWMFQQRKLSDWVSASTYWQAIHRKQEASGKKKEFWREWMVMLLLFNVSWKFPGKTGYWDVIQRMIDWSDDVCWSAWIDLSHGKHKHAFSATTTKTGLCLKCLS